MKINQAFRYELDPTNVQRTLLAKSAGVARFAYNWGLADRKRRFEEKEGKAKFTTAIEQHRLLNTLKATEFPWMYEVSNFWNKATRYREFLGNQPASAGERLWRSDRQVPVLEAGSRHHSGFVLNG